MDRQADEARGALGHTLRTGARLGRAEAWTGAISPKQDGSHREGPRGHVIVGRNSETKPKNTFPGSNESWIHWLPLPPSVPKLPVSVS